MSDAIQSAVAALNEKMPDGFDGLAKFVIGEAGAVMIDASGARPENDAGDEEADVTLTADTDVFQAILAGEMNPTAAFMTGKLRIDGNMALALKLGAALG